MTRVAAVDLGTNSTRLLVADVEDGELDRDRRAGSRSRDSAKASTSAAASSPSPIARVRNCLAEYRRELEALGAERTLCIATSVGARRRERRGVPRRDRVELRLHDAAARPATEEAAMMLRGVTAGRPPLDDALVVDIGGGSTELVLASDGERRVLDEPRRRLRATHRALSRARILRRAPSSPRRAATCASLLPAARGDGARSAWRER